MLPRQLFCSFVVVVVLLCCFFLSRSIAQNIDFALDNLDPVDVDDVKEQQFQQGSSKQKVATVNDVPNAVMILSQEQKQKQRQQLQASPSEQHSNKQDTKPKVPPLPPGLLEKVLRPPAFSPPPPPPLSASRLRQELPTINSSETLEIYNRLHSGRWSFLFTRHPRRGNDDKGKAVDDGAGDDDDDQQQKSNRKKIIEKALYVFDDTSEFVNEETSASNGKQKQKQKATSSSPICPPQSTAEGVWGLASHSYFTSQEFYHQDGPPYGCNRPLGQWIVGNREAVLKRFCRHGATNYKFCDWSPKPFGFNPFKGGNMFWVNVTAAIYWRGRDVGEIESIVGQSSGRMKVLGAIENLTSPSSALFPPLSSSSASSSPSPSCPVGRVNKNNSINNNISNNNNKTAPTDHRYNHHHHYDNNPNQHNISFCYDFQSAARCLANKVVVFLGDSHVLNLAEVVCRMVVKEADPSKTGVGQGVCGPFDIRFAKTMTVVHVPGVNTTIALLRVRYNLLDQMYRFDTHPWARFLEGAHFVVVGRGMWDLVYKDTPRKLLTTQYAESLKYVARRFKFARIIVKLVHFDHKHMWNCSSDARLRELRDSNICSTYIAQTEIAQESQSIYNSIVQAFHRKWGNSNTTNSNNNNFSLPSILRHFDPHKRFAILDIYGASREAPYAHATDELGHHYEGSIMESMAQQLLSIMCPASPTPQNYTAVYERILQPIAKKACHRILTLSEEQERRVPKCSCNDVEFGGYKVQEALEFCKSFYKTSQIVAYFTDV